MHRRQAITAWVRDQIAAQLPGLEVTVGRIYPEGFDRLPMVNVAPGSEEREDEQPTTALAAPEPAPDSRALQIVVELAAAGNVGAGLVADYQVDDLALEVEIALAQDDTAGGLADWFRYVGAEEPERGEADGPLAKRDLQYLARYTVDRRNPT